MDEVRCACGRLLFKAAPNLFFKSSNLTGKGFEMVCPRCKRVNEFCVSAVKLDNFKAISVTITGA